MLSIYTLRPREAFGSNMYLVECSGEFAVIDPSVDFHTVAQKHPAVKSSTRYIIITHAHFDHMLEIDTWREATGAEVLVSAADGAALSDPYKNAYRLFFNTEKGYYGPYTAASGNDTFSLGDESFTILETPGHTEGGICVLFRECVFVGDTVFADGGYGRCDLPGGDFTALATSIRRLCALDRRLTVYPGHGRPTDIGEIYSFFSNM